jgi:hypothetical protein
MKKLVFLSLALSATLFATAQTTKKTAKDWSKFDFTNRAADHLMIQYGGDSWTDKPTSLRTGNGFSRHFNVYFMFDKPFKTNPKFSVAYGIGLGTSNIFFNNTKVDFKSAANTLQYSAVDSLDHFKKNKVTSIYAEIPAEIRYYSNPENPNKSWKVAFGVKAGSLLKAYSKGKNLVNKLGQSLYGTSYIEKDVTKRYINGTMLAVTGRIGYGNWSIGAGYQFNGVLKEGFGPTMHRLSVGITLSGL